MKVEALTFNQLATELHLCNILSNGDVNRVERSYTAKGVGFIHDLACLASDIRLALSSETFALSEHTKCVFKRARGSVLPRFLLGALRRVFHDNGSLKVDYCLETASQLLMFCDALKRTDPPRSHAPRLEAQLWSGIKERFLDEDRVLRELAVRMDKYPTVRARFFRIKEHFRSLLEKANMDEYAWAVGPGKNLDRYEACTAPSWRLKSHLPNVGPASRKVLTWVERQFNRVPFEHKKSLSAHRFHIGSYKGDRALRGFNFSMRCSAQPKSYKAFRGVGVMHAARMTAQLALQRVFYRDCLNEQLPLTDQDEMRRNLADNWDHIGTVDLSAASDRVYWSVLYALGKGVPWFDAAYELRTRELILPDGPIECKAPVMGEGITFPLLSAYLYAVCMAVCDEMGGGHELVRVYGDDIQTMHFWETCVALEQLGLEVSRSKSYPPDSAFKESCEAHYVGRDGRLRAARPAFIVSGKLNRRGRMSHVDAYRLLTLAKSAWVRNPCLARACCAVVRTYTSITLPRVPFNTSALGEPTLSHADHGALELCMKSEDEVPLGQRGALRKLLSTSGLNAPTDLKLSSKMEHNMTLRVLKKIRYRDTLLELENHIFVRIGLLHAEESVQQMQRAGLSDQDIRSWVIAHVPEDDVVAALELLIELVKSVDIK